MSERQVAIDRAEACHRRAEQCDQAAKNATDESSVAPMTTAKEAAERTSRRAPHCANCLRRAPGQKEIMGCLPMMPGRLWLAYTFKMSGKIVVASKFSVLKENAAAFDKNAITVRSVDRGIPSTDPIAVKLLFKAHQSYAAHGPTPRPMQINFVQLIMYASGHQ